MTRLILTFILFIGYLFPTLSHADEFCFATAQTYYEQLYCELKAKGKAANLPDFNQFQKNNATTQALLLKLSAARELGIELKIPKQQHQKHKAAKTLAISIRSNEAGAEDCSYSSLLIQCGQTRYRYIGNQANSKLSTQALTDSNRMQLPVYKRGDLQAYLVMAYEHYLFKMMDIGLAGATWSYGKFAYLHNDLRDKGVSFTRRFEKMYRYLKKDKRNMRVRKSTAANDLSADDCYLLTQLTVCSQGLKNYLYRKQ